MKRNILCGALVGLICVPAMAARVPAAYDSIARPEYSTSGSRVAILADDFESYTLGVLPPQGGWSSDWDANATVVAGGIQGQSVMHSSDGTTISGMEMNSPIVAEQFGVVAADICIDGIGSTYHFITSGPVYYNTRVAFEPDGRITVGQLNSTGDAFEFIDSTGTWAMDEMFQLGVEVLPSGTLNVYKNGTPVFSGLELAYDLTGTAAGMEQYMTFAGNEDYDTYLLDNLTGTLVPEPTTLGLLAIGGLCCVRRRR